ncbi:MAG: ATP-binding protein [archaeon]|nr:ATP-binding protein [archaeon]
MSAGPTKRHLSHIAEVNDVPILKYSAIYGANAAGKTSLIEAFKGSRNMICGEPIRNYTYRCCRSIPGNNEKPTCFEYFFENKGRFFQFGFESVLSSGEFASEWLYEVFPDVQNDLMNEILIYDIEKKDGTIQPNWAYFDGESEKAYLDRILRDRDPIESDNEDNEDPDRKPYDVLFISKLKERNPDEHPRLKILHEVLRWFSDKLRIDPTTLPVDEDGILRTCRYMSRYDTDISGGEYRFENDVSDTVPTDLVKNLKEGVPMVIGDDSKIVLENGSVNKYTLHIRHGMSDTDFKMNEESGGTRELFRIVNTLFNPKDDDITYIFDGFGLTLHPILVSAIFKDYQEYNIDGTNQLIMATHHTSIMGYDHLRRDEIWFIEKEEGVSRVYSLEDFTERPDAEISKRYLEGRYGALPVFREFDTDADDIE